MSVSVHMCVCVSLGSTAHQPITLPPLHVPCSTQIPSCPIHTPPLFPLPAFEPQPQPGASLRDWGEKVGEGGVFIALIFQCTNHPPPPTIPSLHACSARLNPPPTSLLFPSPLLLQSPERSGNSKGATSPL